MMEIINGVNIEWSKFKVEANGKHLERAKEVFVDFNIKLDEIGFMLDSYYTGVMEKVCLRSKLNNGIKWLIAPVKFKRTYDIIKKIINKDKDIFVGICEVKNGETRQDIIIELIEKKFNTNFKINIGQYEKFVNSREDFYNMINKLSFKCCSPYIKAKEKVIIQHIENENLILNTTYDQFSNTYKSLKKVININKDEFVGVVGIDNNKKGQDLILEFKESMFGSKFTTKLTAYNRVIKAREDFYKKLDEVGFEPKTAYLSSEDKVEIVYKTNKNITLTINPEIFKRSTYKSLKKIMNTDKDEFISVCEVLNDNTLLVELKETMFNSKFIINVGNYNKFIEGREEIYNICKDNNYKILSPYIRSRKKMLVDFNCGHAPHWITPNALQCGQRCPKCSNNCPEQAKEEYYELVKEEGYEVLGTYKGIMIKVKMKCPNEHILHMSPNDFKNNNHRCPKCKTSKGERKIIKWFKGKNINCEIQKGFKELKIKRELKYDVYIPSLNWLIEYDGKQHFEPIDFAGKGEEWAIEQFKETQRRDKIKNEFAKTISDYFTRIPYWDFDNIEQILDNKLKEILDTKEEYNRQIV